MQLLHVQHPQHGLQRLRTHRQTLFEGVPRCHSTNLDDLTRVIGYMKRISNFSQARQQEAARRYYNRPERIEGGVEERSVAAPRRDE